MQTDAQTREAIEKSRASFKITHTQGKWTISGKANCLQIWAPLTPICYISDNTNLSEKEHEANAKLIASAPDLLEIAKSYLKYFEEKADHDELSASEIQQWTKTHEAIEKATK